MPVHDPPDPALILPGKQVIVPSKCAIVEDMDTPVQKAPAKTKGSTTTKKRPSANASESDSDEMAKKAVPPTKKQKRKEKVTQLSSTIAAISHNGEKINELSDSSPPSPASDARVIKPKATTQKHKHRLEFPGRPKLNCAADHPSLRASDSLAWTYLVLTNPEHDDASNLVSSTITCALCIDEGRLTPRAWTGWHKKKSGGSTGNFLKHFKK
jgi:hypothetical protein